MRLAIIVAHDPNLVIGKDGALPWHYSKDLKHFKSATMGHPLLMGRRVFEELNKKPLPGRENVVLSRSHSFTNVSTFSCIDDALSHLKNRELVFVIGGATVYKQLLPRVDKLIVTEIHQTYKGDTRFPEYRDKIDVSWKEVQREDHPELSFVVYERMK